MGGEVVVGAGGYHIGQHRSRTFPSLQKVLWVWDFPGGPVIKTLPSNAGGVGSIPGQGAKISHASWPKKQNMKQKKYCNKFYKDFRNGPYKVSWWFSG